MNVSKVDFKKLNDLYDCIKVNNKAKRVLKAHLLPDLVVDLELWISSQPLVKNDSGKYDAELTLNKITNENLKQALLFIYKIPRSFLIHKVKKNKEQYSSLVPLFLAAHKKYNNVNYEEWDKTSKYFNFLVGKHLWQGISPWLDLDVDSVDVEDLRNQYGENLAKWLNSTIGTGDVIFKSTDFARYIITQTWMAHVSNRNRFMILDLQDWDNIPEPLDEVIKPPEEEEEELPF